jgi:hypothetical protein
MPPTAEPMSRDTLAALIILAAIGGAVLLYYASKVYFWAQARRLGVSSLYEDEGDGYVTPRPRPERRADRAEPVFELAEPPRGIQPEQLRTAGEDAPLSISDLQTLDRLGQLLASKALSSEAAAIETFFPGVKRGGSKRYLQLRDHLRAAALRHGWKAPEQQPPARVSPIAGRELPRDAQFFDDPAPAAEAR